MEKRILLGPRYSEQAHFYIIVIFLYGSRNWFLGSMVPCGPMLLLPLGKTNSKVDIDKREVHRASWAGRRSKKSIIPLRASSTRRKSWSWMLSLSTSEWSGTWKEGKNIRKIYSSTWATINCHLNISRSLLPLKDLEIPGYKSIEWNTLKYYLTRTANLVFQETLCSLKHYPFFFVPSRWFYYLKQRLQEILKNWIIEAWK